MRLPILAVALLAASPLGAQDATRTAARDSAIRAAVVRGMPGEVAYVKQLVVVGDTALVSVVRYRPPRPGELTELYGYRLRLILREGDWVAVGMPRLESIGTIGRPRDPEPEPSKPKP